MGFSGFFFVQYVSRTKNVFEAFILCLAVVEQWTTSVTPVNPDVLM